MPLGAYVILPRPKHWGRDILVYGSCLHVKARMHLFNASDYGMSVLNLLTPRYYNL